MYVYHLSERIFNKSFAFLALLDIKAFGRLSLDTMLLLIGLALFYTQTVFVLRIIIRSHNNQSTSFVSFLP